jgi:hypothetical protein
MDNKREEIEKRGRKMKREKESNKRYDKSTLFDILKKHN